MPLVVDEHIELPQLELVQNSTADCTQVYSTGKQSKTKRFKVLLKGPSSSSFVAVGNLPKMVHLCVGCQVANHVCRFFVCPEEVFSRT